MPTKALTDKAIEKAKPAPAGTRVMLWDALLPGFGLRVTDSGHKTFIVMKRLNGELIRRKIGVYPATPLGQARTLARDALLDIDKGVDPKQRQIDARRERERRKANSLSAVAGRFLAEYVDRNRLRWRETRRILEVDVLPILGARPIDEIAREEIADLLRKKAGAAPVQANRTLRVIRKLFYWAVDEGIVAATPVAKMKPPGGSEKDRARDRVLSDPEIADLWNAAESLGYPFGPMAQLLLLTAQRREEVAGMRWREIDLDGALWTIPKERTKSARAHDVPLSPQAVAILKALDKERRRKLENRPRGAPPKGDHVFTTTDGERPVSGFSKAKARIDAAMTAAREQREAEAGPHARRNEPPEAWTLHDLRRTAASVLARLNTPVHVVSRILNHVEKATMGITAVYLRHSYIEERKAALAAWGRYVETLLTGNAGNVVELAKAREAVNAE